MRSSNCIACCSENPSVRYGSEAEVASYRSVAVVSTSGSMRVAA